MKLYPIQTLRIDSQEMIDELNDVYMIRMQGREQFDIAYKQFCNNLRSTYDMKGVMNVRIIDNKLVIFEFPLRADSKNHFDSKLDENNIPYLDLDYNRRS